MGPSAIRDLPPSLSESVRSSPRAFPMDSVLYTTTVRSPQAACRHRARHVQRSHRMNRRVDAHRNRTSSFPGAQTPHVSSSLSCHPGSPHTRVQGNPHGWIRRRTTSSIYPRDTQGLVRKHCRAPILHWQRKQVQPDHRLDSVPLQKANRVGSPKILRRACIVDAFCPSLRPSIPSSDIRWAVPSALTIPAATHAMASQRLQLPRRVARKRPALSGEGAFGMSER